MIDIAICKRYRNLFEDGKEKKRQYGRERYKKFLENVNKDWVFQVTPRDKDFFEFLFCGVVFGI